MITTLNLGQKISINSVKSARQIGNVARKYDKSCQRDLYGLWDPRTHTIYVAKDVSKETQKQILIHEIAEAIAYMAELDYENHDKILLLEQFLTMLLTNNDALLNFLNNGKVE